MGYVVDSKSEAEFDDKLLLLEDERNEQEMAATATVEPTHPHEA